MDCGGGEPDLWQVDDLEARYLGDGLVDREPGVDADPAVGGVVVVRDRGSGDLDSRGVERCEQLRVEGLDHRADICRREAGADRRSDSEVDGRESLRG